jgi:hypothetical protein
LQQSFFLASVDGVPGLASIQRVAALDTPGDAESQTFNNALGETK